MKLKNIQIVKAIDAVNELSNAKLPIKLTYQILEMVEILQQEYSLYIKCLEKLDEKDPNFNSELEELINIEKDLNIKKLKKTDLVNTDVLLSPFSLVALKPLIEEEENGEYSTSDRSD